MTGEPSYVELGVRDAEAAKSFFGELFGWQPAGPGQVETATLSIGINETSGFGRWVECADDQGVRFGMRQSS
jgi:predicted enzyme related to lactoylglutathione lyase